MDNLEDLALKIADIKEPHYRLMKRRPRPGFQMISDKCAWIGDSNHTWQPCPLDAAKCWELLEELRCRVRWLEVIKKWGVVTLSDPLNEIQDEDLKKAVALAWLEEFK